MSWRKRIALVTAVALMVVVASSPFWLRPQPADPLLEKRLPEPVANRAPEPPRPLLPRLPIRVLDARGQPVEDVVVDLSSERLSEVGVSTDAEGWLPDHGLDHGYPVHASVRWRRAEPRSGVLEDPEDELILRFIDPCPVEVRVLDPRGEPVRATLELSSESSARSAEVDGSARLELPCEDTWVQAWVPGHATLETWIAPQRTETLTLRARAGQRLFGRVLMPSGQAVEGVYLGVLGQDTDRSDSLGHYQVWVQRSGPHLLQVDDGDFEPQSELVYLPEDRLELEHDVVVAPAHHVEVRCIGLEDDSCAWVPLIQCTEPELPVGILCQERGEVRCRCPEGEAAVRGGGQAVLIGPEDDIAWLDFRAEGALSGRVLLDGEPGHCKLSATQGLGIGLSGLSLRIESCDAEGRFVIDNLEPGLWTLTVQAGGAERSLGPLRVEGAEDLGDVELLEGTLVHGVVTDALSGEPAQGVAVAAVALAEGRPVGAVGGRSGPDGEYTLRGLPPGEVEVFLAASPFERGSGELVEELRVDLEYSPPGEVALEADRDGQRVTALGEGAPEGLELGDRVHAVELFGVDPLEWVPELEPVLVGPLLGAAGVPGVQVVVEREGELVELP